MNLIITNRKGEKFVVLYSKRDSDKVNQYKWRIRGDEYKYAVKYIRKGMPSGKCKIIWMHRFILGVDDHRIVDHKNRNTLDNRRSNIRVCTFSQNSCNKRAHGKSKYLGVHWIGRLSKWVARIKTRQKRLYLGLFKNEIDAAMAYDKAAIKVHKRFANLNFK